MAEQTRLTPLVVDDFSGGMTDYYIGGESRSGQRYDNFVINENRDAITRPGARLKYNERIDALYALNGLIDHDNSLLMQCGPKVRYYSGGAQNITSPQGHDVFTDGSDSTKANFAFWNKHTLAVSDDLRQPQKIYKDQDGNWKASNLGLPDILYASSITLANDLKAKFNAHIANVGNHTSGVDAVNTVSQADAHDFDSLVALADALLTAYSAHQSDAALAAAWLYHAAQEASSKALESLESPRTVYQCYLRLKDLKAKFNLHDADSVAHGGTTSAHQSVEIVEPEVSGGVGANSYIYSFYFVYRYMVEDVEFIEYGKPHIIEVSGVDAPDVTVKTIKIPELVSGSKENWDDANIKIGIGRSLNTGGVLYQLKEVSNGTLTTTDSLSDDSLKNNAPLYTEGGVVDNDMPPPAKFVNVAGDIIAFGYIKEGTAVYPNRVRATKPNQPSASPEDFYLDFEGDVTALAHVGIYPIIFLRNKSYRIEGRFDSQGRGGFQKRSISQKVGCISQKSVVYTENEIYFAGDEGFYVTDGFKVKRISKDINKSYAALYNKENIQGAYDKEKNRICWSVQVNETATANDQVWVAHLDYTTRLDSHPFTSWSGGRSPSNFSASALGYIDGVFYRADRRSYLLYHDDDATTDPFIDTTLAPAEWYTQTIFYDYRSVAFDFDNAQIRKWATKLNVNADNVSSLSLQVSANNDNSGIFGELKAINKPGNIEWGDPTVVWGVSDLRWDYFPVISVWRYFPADSRNKLRCMYKQVKFENAYVEIDNSSAGGPASINSILRTVALDNAPTSEWPGDPVNYFISFAYDDYEIEYPIVALGGGELTLLDSSGTLETVSGVDWRIRGYKKREVLNLLNYVISYRLITMTQDTYRAGQ